MPLDCASMTRRFSIPERVRNFREYTHRRDYVSVILYERIKEGKSRMYARDAGERWVRAIERELVSNLRLIVNRDASRRWYQCFCRKMSTHTPYPACVNVRLKNNPTMREELVFWAAGLLLAPRANYEAFIAYSTNVRLPCLVFSVLYWEKCFIILDLSKKFSLTYVF